jgi:hypothetical protein
VLFLFFLLLYLLGVYPNTVILSSHPFLLLLLRPIGLIGFVPETYLLLPPAPFR